ncbi:hypothetical protein DUNSADRAFT_5376 [Dunaliella salina]|uniref:Uncharacterized protein n=1 Tax=Dunaliella salina TaxID=3046 RepID=A0ABQ7FUB0_DUNSA|nr:hypothetical protein DUNSADRAFT_5425 [Dunaliella salina]KAF5826015.1 hypothetical protein DUNSADRAFT_5376 [Dunaliella salina]|eukprot:KAF5826007.1 hypothetical protein DUNSADRAFT_5425 [Dunaliella salina]
MLCRSLLQRVSLVNPSTSAFPCRTGQPLRTTLIHVKGRLSKVPRAEGYDASKYPQVPPASGAWGQEPPPYPPPYPQVPEDPSQPSSNPFAGMSEQEAYDQDLLQKSSVMTKNLSFVAFWLQFALSVVSAGILLFSVAFVPRGPYNVNSTVDASKYLTLVGVIAAFISSLMAHGFLTMSRRIQSGKRVAKNYLVNSLLTNNFIALAGIGITVIGLQASVGTLVAKTLMTSATGQLAAQNANQLVSLDVFALQASTNTLLCHVIGLLFTNLMLRIVNKPRKEPKSA